MHDRPLGDPGADGERDYADAEARVVEAVLACGQSFDEGRGDGKVREASRAPTVDAVMARPFAEARATPLPLLPTPRTDDVVRRGDPIRWVGLVVVEAAVLVVGCGRGVGGGGREEGGLIAASKHPPGVPSSMDDSSRARPPPPHCTPKRRTDYEQRLVPEGRVAEGLVAAGDQGEGRVAGGG